VAYDPTIKTLTSNPVRELVNLRNGTLGSAKAVCRLHTRPAHEPIHAASQQPQDPIHGTNLRLRTPAPESG
jgi:hypothetical protein